MNHNAKRIRHNHGDIRTAFAVLLLLFVAVDALELTEHNEDDCGQVQCAELTVCPPDSELKIHDDDIAAFDEVDYDEELSTNDPFEGVHIEALEAVQPSSVAAILATTPANSQNTTTTAATREKRELMFASAEQGATLKRCCTNQCVCRQCPAVPKCSDSEVAVRVQSAAGVPGDCCHTFECAPKVQCGEGEQAYWRDTCTLCSCFAGAELCHNQCQNDAPQQQPEEEAYKDCYSEYLQMPKFHGSEWFEDDYCSECKCTNGERECTANLCAAVECENPKKVPGKCCPVCAAPELDSEIEVPPVVVEEQTAADNMTSTTAETTNVTDTEAIVGEGITTERSKFATSETTASAATEFAMVSSTSTVLSTSSAVTPSTSSNDSTATSEIQSSSTTTTAYTTESTTSSVESISSTSAAIFSTSTSKSTENPISSEDTSTSSSSTATLPESTSTSVKHIPDADSTSSTTTEIPIAPQSSSTTTSPFGISTSSAYSTSSPLIVVTDNLSTLFAPSAAAIEHTSSAPKPTLSTTTNVPSLVESQPTSYRQNELALSSNNLEEDYSTVNTLFQKRNTLLQLNWYTIVIFVLVIAILISIVVVLTLILCRNKNKKQRYTNLPGSDTSSQTSTPLTV